MQNKVNNQQKIMQNHTINLENQSKAHITGVYEVITATQKGVFCKLASSNLQICGENLKVEKLSPEEKLLIVVGTIYDIKYSQSTTKAGFFKKLFR